MVTALSEHTSDSNGVLVGTQGPAGQNIAPINQDRVTLGAGLANLLTARDVRVQPARHRGEMAAERHAP